VHTTAAQLKNRTQPFVTPLTMNEAIDSSRWTFGEICTASWL